MPSNSPATRTLDISDSLEISRDLPFRLGRGRMVIWRDRLLFAYHKILKSVPPAAFRTDEDEFGAAAVAASRGFAIEYWPLPERLPSVETWARGIRRSFWLALATRKGLPVFVLNTPAPGGSDRYTENRVFSLNPVTAAWLRLRRRSAESNVLEEGQISEDVEASWRDRLSQTELILWKDKQGDICFAEADHVVEGGVPWLEARLPAIKHARQWERRNPPPDLAAWSEGDPPQADWFLNDLERDETHSRGKSPRYRIRGLGLYSPGAAVTRRRPSRQVVELLRGVPLPASIGRKLLLFVRVHGADLSAPPRDRLLVLRDPESAGSVRPE